MQAGRRANNAVLGKNPWAAAAKVGTMPIFEVGWNAWKACWACFALRFGLPCSTVILDNAT